MKNWITFHSSLPDPHKEDEAGESVIEPGGHKHIQILADYLARKYSIAMQPWNEEDFAWEFLCTIDGITFDIILQESWGEPDGNWLVILRPLALFKWLRQTKIAKAYALAETALLAWIASEKSFSNMHQYTSEEFRSLESKTTRAARLQ